MSDDGKPETVKLPENLTIRSAHALRDRLLEGLSESDSLVLEVSPDADVDVSFIQLLEAARIHAARVGKSVSLKHPASAGLLDTLRRAGFPGAMDGAASQFWFHGRTVQ